MTIRELIELLATKTDWDVRLQFNGEDLDEEDLEIISKRDSKGRPIVNIELGREND